MPSRPRLPAGLGAPGNSLKTVEEDATSMRHRLNNSLFGKAALAAAALAGFLMFTGAPLLRADNDDCQRRVVRADHRLHEAIEHHGYQSREAERRRHELHEAREHCWSAGHRWWD